MFSLIIVLIAIVLVVVIAVATIFYGGEIFSRSGADAETSALLAQAAQIASAAAAYHADKNGVKAGTLQDLVDSGFLNSVPPGWQEPAEGDVAITSKVIESLNACQLFNERQGIDEVPYCDDVENLSHPVCCQ